METYYLTPGWMNKGNRRSVADDDEISKWEKEHFWDLIAYPPDQGKPSMNDPRDECECLGDFELRIAAFGEAIDRNGTSYEDILFCPDWC